MHGSLFRNMVDWFYMAAIQYSYMESELKGSFKRKSSAGVFMY